MLDTLALMFDDFEVATDNLLEVHQSLTSQNYLLFGNTYGTKAYLNYAPIHIDVKNIRGKPYLFVHFSMPKLADKPHNTYGLTKAEAHQAFIHLRELLESCGIYVNFDTAKVTRLDTALNIDANYQLEAYIPIFGMMRDSRLVKQQTGNTTRWQNKQREFCVYDKRQELADSGLAPDLFDDVPDNTLRFETRQLKHSNVQDDLRIKTPGDVLACYDDLDAIASRVWQQRLFYVNPKDTAQSELITVMALIEASKQTNTKQWSNQSMVLLGLYHLAGLTDAERKVVLSLYDRRMAQDFARRIRQVKADTISVKLADLYAELQSKIKAYDSDAD